MNWKLIFQLSLFGLFMAIGTVYFIPVNVEMILSILIVLVSAYLIAKKAPGKYFWHGFVVSLLNSFWIVSAHILLVKTYLENRPEQLEMLAKTPLPEHPRYMMLMIGPIVGIIFGIILGVLSFVASKIFKKAK